MTKGENQSLEVSEREKAVVGVDNAPKSTATKAKADDTKRSKAELL